MGQIIYIDRSRVETRQACGRKRFWEYDYDLTGIARTQGSLPLLNGLAIHAAHARLLAGQPIEEVIALVRAEYQVEVESKGVFGDNDTVGLMNEQMAMLEGMVRLWAMWRLPKILEEYELADFGNGPAIEQAWEWELAPGLRQHLRMDAILRRRGDGLLHILDYKSAGYTSDGWRDKFEHCLQTELYVQALKEHTGEPVGGMLYEGLIKGQYRKDTARSSPYYGQRIQSSPYCYGYVLQGQAGDVWLADFTAKKGFRKVRITDLMSTKEWVEEHLQYLVQPSDMFVAVTPICPPPYELERIKAQVIYQELWYHKQLDNYRTLVTLGHDNEAQLLLDQFAPQNGAHCYHYGLDYKCPFVTDVCWTSGANPLEDGGFEPRTPHHEEAA